VNRPVVIAAFRSHAEALAARGALETEGISAAITTPDPAIPRLCAGAFRGGYDILVSDSDAADGVAVVQRLFPDEREAPLPIEQCPACGSTEITTLPRLLIFLITAPLLVIAGAFTGERDLFLLVIGIFGALLLFAPGRRCRVCGERWYAPWPRRAPENAIEPEAAICPHCGSEETERIGRRREKAITLLVNMIIPPTIVVWPMLKKWRCARCGKEWR
jgi:RNA polymerase subunit RPABC4/transcription elongation factor Spt4